MQIQRYAFALVLATAIVATAAAATSRSKPAGAPAKSSIPTPSAACDPGGICLVATVGTDLADGACGVDDAIDANVGDQLNFCYTVTNDTAQTLGYQSLVNSVDGTLLDFANHPVAPGDSYQFNHIETMAESHVYAATWTAFSAAPGYAFEVEAVAEDCLFADGFENEASPCGGSGASQFIDITGTGTALGLADEHSADVEMPFAFDFYGTTSDLVTVSDNGGVLFNTPGGYLDWDNGSLPSNLLITPAIFPLWDDFYGDSGDIYVDTRGVAPNRRFIVEWVDLEHYPVDFNTDGATFELILNEDGTIQFEYDDVGYTGIHSGSEDTDQDDCTGGICATIGMQHDPSVFDQFSAFEATVADHSGIKWTPRGISTFTSTASVTVDVGAPRIVVNPDPIVGTASAGATTTIPFAIENQGDRDLYWTLDEAAANEAHFPPPGTRFSMPLGDPAKATAARAPRASRHAQGGKPRHLHAPLAQNAVPVFGADIFYNVFEALDALDPQAVDTIAPTDETPWTGGAFVGGDFSKLYVIAGNFADNADQFATIDTTTGAKTLIGTADSGGDGWNGLAYDPTTGTLYAVSGCGSGSRLFTIDIATGEATLIGALPNETCSIAIAIDAGGRMFGVDVIADALFAIDKATAEDALIGSVGFDMNFAQDMAFDPSTGILYLAGFDFGTYVDSLYTVDIHTGMAVLVAPIASGDGELDAMGIETVNPCSQPGDVPWLSLDSMGGTTAPGSVSDLNASIDATAASEGEVLSATVCAFSNDPIRGILPTSLSVTVTAGIVAVPPTLQKAFNPSTVETGAPSTLTIRLDNTANASSIAALSAALTDAFPSGLVVATPPNASTDCEGALTADAGTDSVSLDASGASIPAGGICTITVDVAAGVAGTYDNTIAAGALDTDLGSNTGPATASLEVKDAVGLLPPTIAKAFAPSTIAPDETSVLTITLGNDNGNDISLAAPLTDAFPSGLVVAAVPNASTDCGGGVLSADAGTDSVTLDAGATIPAGGTCSITVDVTPTAPDDADYPNSIPPGALQTDAGENATSADAMLRVMAPPAPLPPTVAVTLSPTSVATDAPSMLTITLGNANSDDATATTFTNTLPSGLVVASTPNASTGCGGNLTANAGDGSIALDSATIPASGLCMVSVDVSAAAAGAYVDTIDAGALDTSLGGNVMASSDSVIVTGSFPAPYCAFVAGSEVEPITRVDFAGIAHASSEAIAGGGSSEQSEDDLAVGGGAIAPGGAYSLSVEGNTNGDFEDLIRVYFDWNHDGVFATDGSESADIASITNSTGIDGMSTSNVVPVPPTAKIGLTRMRVVKTWAFYGAACGDNDFGQAEDYLVLVDPSAAQPPVPPVASSAVAPAYLATSDGISTLTITLTNYNTDDLALSSAMNDTLPAGVIIANPSNAVTTCAGTGVQSNPGDSAFSLDAGAVIPASGSCVVHIDVTATTPGIYTPTLPIGAVATVNGGNPQPAVTTIQFADPNGAATYWTGFETPDFAAADLDGQQGWYAQANVTAPSVATMAPATGAQHAQLNSTASTATTNYPFALSPAQLKGTSPYSTLSANLRMSRTVNGSTWEFDPQDSTTQTFATRIRFDKGSVRRILVADFAQGTFIDTGATWPVDTYFKLDIVVERATGVLDLCMDGTPIFHDNTGVDVASRNITQASVSQVLQSGSTAANTIFVDDIAIDNPGTSPCGVAPKPLAPASKKTQARTALSRVRQIRH
jgi:hypothetical protein